jgi:hypothetical protein
MEGKHFFVPSYKPEPSLATFKEVGAPVEVSRTLNGLSVGLPCAEIEEATFWFPFIVRVKWNFYHNPLNGSGQTRYFICVFGKVIHRWDTHNWIA